MYIVFKVFIKVHTVVMKAPCHDEIFHSHISTRLNTEINDISMPVTTYKL